MAEEMGRMEYCRAIRDDSRCFYKVLFCPQNKELRIPPAFVKHITEEATKAALLKGPCGKLWNVKLRKDENEMFFHDGWKKFQTEQQLEGGEFLAFHYDGRMTFYVSIFDMDGVQR